MIKKWPDNISVFSACGSMLQVDVVGGMGA